MHFIKTSSTFLHEKVALVQIACKLKSPRGDPQGQSMELTPAILARSGLRRGDGVGLSNDQLRRFASEGFTDPIKVFQIDPRCNVMIEVIDCRWSNICCSCQISLRPSPLAKQSRQAYLNHKPCSFTRIIYQISYG